MKIWRTLVAAIAIQAVAVVAGHAASLEQIKSSGEFRIGTEGTYPPFTYHNDQGKLVGFDVEIGREIAKRLGVKAKFLEGPWDGLIAGLDAGRYDAVINEVGITKARQQKYDFSEPYIASKAVLIVRSDNDAIKSFDDLKGKSSAQTLTSNFGKIAESHGATIVSTNGFDQSIQLVVNHRADATINDSLSFLDFKKHKPNAPVKVVASLPDATVSGVIVSKGEPKLVAAINKALEGMKADGTYLKISKKYFGEDVSK
ncbi:MAG TPA: amino acid ABC transporter substrate-binding protein [Pararhizobium sp.]|nr:amino acid ABC transporter substrate-binding protein [Pararhizobium sp.]